MSIYRSVLFERAPMRVFDSSLGTVHDTLRFYNVAKKTSRKVCRLRDIFWNFAYGEYHDDTDILSESDRIQSYNFGRMEIFV